MILLDIKRGSFQDGPGLRTVLFFKGCPLRCAWCHNPESQQKAPQLAYLAEKCVRCGSCMVCPNDCHQFSEGNHTFLRQNCTACGKCTEQCKTGALRLYGREISVEILLAEAKKDKAFFRYGGGVTFSGGEPMTVAELPLLAEQLYKDGISVCVETCGYAEQEAFASLMEYVDTFLFDIKVLPEQYLKYTGVTFDLILSNLQFLNAHKKKIILRCPLLPDLNMNEQHARFIASLAEQLDAVVGIDLEPYHPLGISKAEAVGKKQAYSNPQFAPKDAVKYFSELLCGMTKKSVVIVSDKEE